MKKIIQLILKYQAKKILDKHKPEIIGITGSIGKTSVKEAVYAVFKKKYKVRRSIKNYNNEIGLPLTIIGADTQGKNIFGWMGVFSKGYKVLKDDDYPRILILEMGIDRPGDMDYLLKIVKCRIGIATFVGSVHAQYFGSKKEIAKEKGKLIESVEKAGWAILNYDNEETRKMAEKSKSKTLTYGFGEKADIRAEGVNLIFDDNMKGLNFKLRYKGSLAPVFLNNNFGQGSVYSALAAAAAGIAYGMNLVEIAEALKEYKAPKGRMNLLGGIKNTYIIDDTYNAEPNSVKAALEALKAIPVKEGAEKFAILGDMLELGRYSEKEHREAGAHAFKSGVGKLILAGERSRDIGRGAKEAGMNKDDIFHFPKSEEAGLFAQERIAEGDIILVKGSQGIRMEKVVKEIMAEPMQAKELLVRQDEEWLRR
jgi:UDP-N-acetylmuramoyl-tripeptide--D-alanyl-D-alanine ligase